MNRFDVEEAFKQHGGFENIQCISRHGVEATVFEFEIQVTSLDIEYQLKLGSNRVLRDHPSSVRDDHHKPKAKDFLRNIRLYRIEPKSCLENYRTIQDPSKLHRDGRNLPAVLSRLEKNDDLRESIIEWLELVVPGLETVQTQTERLTGSTALAFKEAGQDKWFPAHFISEGTIYLLSLLVAILDRPPVGLTLIEEPERGLHPKAILQLA